MMNFHTFNPDYKNKGMDRGSKLDKELLLNYKGKLDELHRIAARLRKAIETRERIASALEDEYVSAEAPEGMLLTRLHRGKERNRKIVEMKKEQEFYTNGALKCEACRFDFQIIYRKRGEKFIECHHNKPVSELTPGEKTNLADLSLVCANCHRMIHRGRPWLTVAEIQQLVDQLTNPENYHWGEIFRGDDGP